ncbi:MAG: cytochrome c family protein [Alphaproteobacteria bacterium]|nr:cytochrome c family protein [Alphaproteobacteria bacterium]
MMNARLLLTGLALFGALIMGSDQGRAQQLHLDPAKVMGPDACGECHKSSIEFWKGSHHFSTFKALPRKKEARSIADKMGLKRIKAGSDCLSCHFTSAMVKGKVKPIAGITCESCHGAGRDWIKVHSDFGGKDVKAENETAAHKAERYAKSEAAGMIRPSKLYKVAQNCYSCHTVPNEKLVNKGGHAAGSKFELVAWSQGEVRHNVWYSKKNQVSPIARLRMMYLVGRALDLEYALRGVAKATKKADYAVKMAKRAKKARKRIKAIAKLIEAPELMAMYKAAKAAKLKLNNEAKLTAAADTVARHAQAMADKYDGSTFAGLDPVLPKPKKYKRKK